MDHSHRVGADRTRPSGVVVRKKFGLIRGHIDADGTISFAAFAGKAKIKRFMDMVVSPSISNRIAFQHFEEEPRAPPRGVHFFPRDAIAGTHRASVFTPALSDADAAETSAGEFVFIVRIMEMCVDVGRVVVGA